MKKAYYIILIVSVFLCSCDTNNTNKPLSDEDYFAQQALKSSQNDTLLLGLTIPMNKEVVITQLEKEGAWKYYSTMTGKDRSLLRGLSSNEILPVDSYGENEAFFAKVILKSENGRFSEETVTVLLDFYEESLLNVIVCVFGGLHIYESDCDNEMFKTLRTTLIEKYGNPYKEKDHQTLWVNGNTHISLSFEGIKKFRDTSIYHPYHFQPLYLITYSNWSFSKEVEELKTRKKQEELRQEKEIDSLNQKRLSKEYKGL